MSETKWTPGRFAVAVNNDDFIAGPQVTVYALEIDAPDEPLATMHGSNSEEVLANAHLFKAAPQLYKALDTAVRLYETYALVAQPTPGDDLPVGRWLADARAALAAARGEQ